MFASLFRRKLTREFGFTMIELLVAVIIIAILAAIAVPVYIGIQTSAVKSALKADVNATVKQASVALVNGATIQEITANYGAAYVASSNARGEVISIVAADPGASATTASLQTDKDLSNDGFVIRSAVYSGKTDGSLKATLAAAENETPFYVYGVLKKSAGAPIDYSYAYSSAANKYTEGTGSGSGSTAAAPTLGSATLPDATISDPYSASIPVTGTPTPSVTATGLPAGMSINSSGVISGTPSGAAGPYTVAVTASNGVSSVSKNYPLLLKSKNQPAAFTSGTSVPNFSAGTAITPITVSTSGYPVPAITVKSGTIPGGLSFHDNGDGTATISGTPTAGGTSSVTLQASNSTATVVQTLNFTVNQAVSLSTSSLPNAITGIPYSATVSTNGYPVPSITISQLPTGLTAKDNGDGTATISGTTNAAGTSVKVVLNGNTASPSYLTLTVVSSTVYSENFNSYASTPNNYYSTSQLPTGRGGSACNGGYPSSGLYTSFNGYSGTNGTNAAYCLGTYNSSGRSTITMYSAPISLPAGSYLANANMYTYGSGSTAISVVDSSTYASISSNGTFTLNSAQTVRLAFTGSYTSGGFTTGVGVDNVTVNRTS